MFRKHSDEHVRIVIILAVLFAIGLILGALSLVYIPKEFVNEARSTLSYSTAQKSMPEMFKSNFMMEIVWMISIWLLGSVNATAPFSAAVIAVRGFFMGFSVAFMLTGTDGGMDFVVSNILPQSAIALPLMSVFTALCVRYSIERKRNEKTTLKYFLTGACFVIITVLTSFFEAVISCLL